MKIKCGLGVRNRIQPYGKGYHVAVFPSSSYTLEEWVLGNVLEDSQHDTVLHRRPTPSRTGSLGAAVSTGYVS